MMTRSNTKVMATALLTLMSISANASLEFRLGSMIDGKPAPGSTAPYLIADFTTAATGPGKVILTLTSSLETKGEFIGNFAFNLDPKYAPKDVTVSGPKGYEIKPEYKQQNKDKDERSDNTQTVPGVGNGKEGKGWDFLITAPHGENSRFGGLATVEFTLTATGLTEGAFNFKNDGGSGTLYVAAHLQGYANGGSGAITIAGEPTFKGLSSVPEPSTYIAGLSALGLLGLFGWSNRKSSLARNQA